MKQAQAITCTKDQLQAWYALGKGTVRDQIGLSSKKAKDGSFKVRLFVKKGATAHPSEVPALLLDAMAVLANAA